MTELALHLNDPSASVIYLSVDVPSADLSVLVSDWMGGAPAPVAAPESADDAMEEADWIAGQLARGRKDLFDPRKSHMVLTAAAQAEMERALGLFPSTDPRPGAPVRSGEVMTFDGSIIVHRSQVLYVAVGPVRSARTRSPETPAPVDGPIVREEEAVPAPAAKPKGLWQQWVDTGKITR